MSQRSRKPTASEPGSGSVAISITPPGPPSIRVEGRELSLSRLGIAEFEQVCKWAKEGEPNPIEAVRPLLAGLDPQVQRGLLESVIGTVLAPVTYGSPTWAAYVQTTSGVEGILWLSLKRAGHDVERRSVNETVASLAMLDLLRLVAYAIGGTEKTTNGVVAT